MKISLGQKTNDEVSEVLRKAIVGGALHGKCVVFDIGKLKGNILAYQPSTENIWPADKIWNFKEWRKESNHMLVVKEDENISAMGSKGAYYFNNSSFTIVILAEYESDEKCQELLNMIPHSKDMIVKFVE